MLPSALESADFLEFQVARNALARLNFDAPTITAVLASCSKDVSDVDRILPPSKKARTTLSEFVKSPHPLGSKAQSLRRSDVAKKHEFTPLQMIVFLDLLNLEHVQSSSQLLSSALDFLSALIQQETLPSARAEYLQQLIVQVLSTLLRSDGINHIAAHEGLRLSPVLDLLRCELPSPQTSSCIDSYDRLAATNPQLAMNSLLLIAHFASLVPDQIVHHIVPVFTFMGANALQRDDAASQRIVDSVFDSVLPVVVRKHKEAAGAPEEVVNRKIRPFCWQKYIHEHGKL